jgi:hypothetical protein
LFLNTGILYEVGTTRVPERMSFEVSHENLFVNNTESFPQIRVVDLD